MNISQIKPPGSNDMPPGGPSSQTNEAPPTGARYTQAADPHADPVLARLKQLEETNATYQNALEQAKTDAKLKDERINFLSADKIKEMQEVIDSGIKRWLASLVGVSEESKEQFTKGLHQLASKADNTNHAWDIVCNASKTHSANVNEIQRLIDRDNENTKLISDLKGFKTEASRIGGSSSNQSATNYADTGDSSRSVRQRVSDTNTVPPAGSNGPKDAWSDFESMLRSDGYARANMLQAPR